MRQILRPDNVRRSCLSAENNFESALCLHTQHLDIINGRRSLGSVRKVFDKFVSSAGLAVVGEAILLPRGVSNFFEFAGGGCLLAGLARDHQASKYQTKHHNIIENINFAFGIAFIRRHN